MSFTETIATLPFAPRSQNATGFLPPVIRGMNHILYLAGCLSDETTEVTDDQAMNELNAAEAHWNARTPSTALSAAIIDHGTRIGTALTNAITEYDGWNDETRTTNLRDLANRIVQYAAALDRELIGLTNSDPGSSL